VRVNSLNMAQSFSAKDSGMERYTCQKCTRHFVASAVAARIPCPNCNFENVLRQGSAETSNSSSGPSFPPVPQYSLEEASGIAKALIAENPETSGGWTKNAVNYEGVDGCWSKAMYTNINNDKIFVNKATSTMDASPQDILNVYWNPKLELEWNATTIQRVTLLEDLSSIQVLHQEIKKNAIVNMQNDVVIRRAFDRNPNGSIWVYAVSPTEGVPAVKPPLTRGSIVFGGLMITPAGNNKSHVTLIWCFDYNKKLQVRYNDEEPKKTALRLCRIKKAIDDSSAVAARAADYARQKAAAGQSN